MDADGSFRGAVRPPGTPTSGAPYSTSADHESATVLGRLLQTAHLVIESPRRGALERWGIAWDELHARCPALSVVRISGFGSTGPYAGYEWDDIVVQAVAGTLLLQGSQGPGPAALAPGMLALCFVGSMAVGRTGRPSSWLPQAG